MPDNQTLPFEVPTRDVLPEAPPTLWVDTNIMLDFYTHTRFWDNRSGGATAMEESRKLMRRAAWLAMALDELQAVSLGFRHETERNTLERAKPGTGQGAWVQMAVWVVKDFCAPGWIPIVTSRGAELATTDERDQLMVDIAKERGLKIISRDRKARRRAENGGALAYKPEEYAEKVIPASEARARFLARLATGAATYSAKHGNTARAVEATQLLEAVYRGIWDGPDAPPVVEPAAVYS